MNILSLEVDFLRFLATGRQHRECIVPQAVTHSLALLTMGKIIARNMLSRLDLLISCYCCIQLAVYIIYVNNAPSSKYQLISRYCFIHLAVYIIYINNARSNKH